MRFKSFEITNFRGIKKTLINLDKSPNGHINALVGLNESGKTTILEAIHHFLSNPNLLKKLPSSSNRTARDYQKMLPISGRALFNGTIEIKAVVEIEPEDWVKTSNFIKKEFGFKSVEDCTYFSISHRIIFEDSKHSKTTNIWDMFFWGRKSGGRTRVRLSGDDWYKAANFVEKMLPKIVYFPSTLLEFPDRIVLEKAPQNEDQDPDEYFLSEPRNDFYCGVLDDVLRSVNTELKMDTHLLQRAKSSSASDKENLDSLLLQMGRNLKETIFTEWKKIFEQAPTYDFQVKLTNIDNQMGLEIKIVTDEGIFSINERSAGFRWFFAFIMLTRYRLHRKDRVLFLFDEPAANLHPNAQTQLLKSFELLSQEADIVYTTHSHYLINPMWLESTHVVQNAASEKKGLFIDNDPSSSAIKVSSYRTFVGSHPEQYFYYKPIQEALDYSPSPLEFPSSVILVEGKTDFFSIKYFSSFFKLTSSNKLPSIFPGGGAGSLDSLISLLHGWGKDFVILVDSDAAGHSQKKRYQTKFENIVKDSIFSLDDVNDAWKGYQIEKLIDKSDLEAIRISSFPASKSLSKKQLHLAIQEQIMQKIKLPISEVTLNNFQVLLDYLDTKLKSKSLS